MDSCWMGAEVVREMKRKALAHLGNLCADLTTHLESLC